MVAATKAVEAKDDGGRNKDRLVLHIGAHLQQMVLQAAEAYSVSTGGLKVTQTDIGRWCHEHGGIIRGKGEPKLRPLHPSLLTKGGHLIPEVDEKKFSERIFLPNSPKWRLEAVQMAEAMSTVMGKVHPAAIGRMVLLASMMIVDGKAVLRPPL